MRSFFILLVAVACTISCSFSVRAVRSERVGYVQLPLAVGYIVLSSRDHELPERFRRLEKVLKTSSRRTSTEIA